MYTTITRETCFLLQIDAFRATKFEIVWKKPAPASFFHGTLLNTILVASHSVEHLLEHFLLEH